jgi:hypothetical protein
VYQRNFCDPYSWNNNHAPENPREQQMLSVLFQKLRERKKEKKKGWVHLFFFRFQREKGLKQEARVRV